MTIQRNVDMCNGRLLPNILKYSLPLILTGLLQLMYNAADMIVVAKWAGGTALAAVGSNSSLINLIVNLFIGLSVGASVAVAQYYGAEDRQNVHQAVHTAMAVSVIGGVFTMVLGLFIARPALEWMGTPPEVIGQSTLYLRIYFLGMPAAMVCNFGISILRAVGDTKRPLYILTASGLINVGLNLLLVIVFHWDVAGVAIATTVSQIFSAVMVVLCLVHSYDSYRLELRKLRIYKDKLLLMLRHGVPAGIQSCIFSASNVIIQSSVNSFGAAAVAGSAAANNLEGLIYTSMNAFQHTCLAFTGQNIGAKRPERLRRVLWTCLLCVTVAGLAMSGILLLFGDKLLTMYTAASSVENAVTPAEILAFGMKRLWYICPCYFLCGVMEVLVGALRGMGSSVTPMIVSIAGVCGVRIMWIYTVFALIDRTLETLFLSYPVSWLLTLLAHAACLLVIQRRVMRRLRAEIATE